MTRPACCALRRPSSSILHGSENMGKNPDDQHGGLHACRTFPRYARNSSCPRQANVAAQVNGILDVRGGPFFQFQLPDKEQPDMKAKMRQEAIQNENVTESRPLCRVVWRGQMDYLEAWDLQRTLAAQRLAGEIPDTLLLLEHPPTITIGRSGKDVHIMAAPEALERQGIALVESDRGGDVTYHGPGQLVGYPILNLQAAPHRPDLHAYLRALEETLIRALAAFGITAGRFPGYTGVWTGMETPHPKKSRLSGCESAAGSPPMASPSISARTLPTSISSSLAAFAIIELPRSPACWIGKSRLRKCCRSCSPPSPKYSVSTKLQRGSSHAPREGFLPGLRGWPNRSRPPLSGTIVPAPMQSEPGSRW